MISIGEGADGDPTGYDRPAKETARRVA